MKNTTYSVIGNRTAADVVAGREETIETGYDLECAQIAANEVQRTGEFVAAWIEEEGAPAPSLDTLKLAVVVADAKARTQDLRWLRAIDRASEGILSGELIVTTLAHGALVTSANGTYRANSTCGCKAFKHGQPCKHRAGARLMEIYESDKRQPVATSAATIVAPCIIRSVERDRSGVRVNVVRVDNWVV